MTLKSKTVDRSIGPQPTSWVTYQRTGGSYVPIGSGSGTSRPLKVNVLYRQWNTMAGWKTYRATYGYLPTQNMTETQEFVDQSGLPVYSYFAYDGQYRVDMKSRDPLHVPALSGSLGFRPKWHTTSELSALREDAKQKCLSQARDMKVNVPVMLGEGRQTVRMLADTVRTLGRAYRNFRRGRFRQAAKELGIAEPGKGSANHWLAYNYGWMPLLSDAKGLVKLAEKGLIDPDRGPRFSVRGNAIDVIPDWKEVISGQGASNLPGGQTTLRGTCVAHAKAGLLLEFKPGATGLASVGLGTFDPLLTAWELTPFSFVFDWFINVGGYLEALSTFSDVTPLAGFESHVEWNYGSATMDKPHTTGWIVGALPQVHFTWRSFKRFSWGGSVTLRTPLWDALNARRLTTVAALWRQRCRGDRVHGKYRP